MEKKARIHLTNKLHRVYRIADVGLPLFEEGMEPAYMRVDHDEAIIVVPWKHLLYLKFVVIDVLYYGYNCQRNKWYHHSTVTIQFSSCYDNTSVWSGVPIQLYPGPNLFCPLFFDSSRPSVCTQPTNPKRTIYLHLTIRHHRRPRTLREQTWFWSD